MQYIIATALEIALLLIKVLLLILTAEVIYVTMTAYVTGCDKTRHMGYFVKFELAIFSITSILEITFCQV